MGGQGIQHRRVVQRVLFHLASLVGVLLLVVVAVLEARVHGNIISISRLSATLVSRPLTASLVPASSILLDARLLSLGLSMSLGLRVSLKLSLSMLLLYVGLGLGLGLGMNLGHGSRMHTTGRNGHARNNGDRDRGGALTGRTRNNRRRNGGNTGAGGSRFGDRSRAGGGLPLGRVLLLLRPTTSRSRPPCDWVKSGIYPPVGVRGGGCNAAFALMLGTAKALEVLSAVGRLAHSS